MATTNLIDETNHFTVENDDDRDVLHVDKAHRQQDLELYRPGLHRRICTSQLFELLVANADTLIH